MGAPPPDDHSAIALADLAKTLTEFREAFAGAPPEKEEKAAAEAKLGAVEEMIAAAEKATAAEDKGQNEGGGEEMDIANLQLLIVCSSTDRTKDRERGQAGGMAWRGKQAGSVARSSVRLAAAYAALLNQEASRGLHVAQKIWWLHAAIHTTWDGKGVGTILCGVVCERGLASRIPSGRGRPCPRKDSSNTA